MLYYTRQLMVRYYDPLIRYTLGEREIYLPLSSNLPFTLRKHPYYDTNVVRIVRYVQQKYPESSFIDVGAYVGDTAASIRQEGIFPLLCIEGNERIYHILEKNMMEFPKVELVKAFLGNPANVCLEHQSIDTATHSQNSISLMEVLKAYPLYARSKMLKVDTDGHDGQILRGALEFLSNETPIIFFEYAPDLLEQHGDNGLSLLRILREHGYKMVLFYEHIGTYMLSTTLDNTQLLEELHQWFSGYGGYR
jgi:FkbM family methyltransferase